MGEINGRVAVNSGPVIKSRTGVNHGKALPHFAAGLAPRNAVRLKSSVHREPHDRGETRGVYTTAPAQDLRDLFHESPPDRVFGHDARVRPRSMLGWLLGGRATPEERRIAGSKCATRASALRQCVGANSEETCDRLAQDLDLCKVRIVRSEPDVALVGVSSPVAIAQAPCTVVVTSRAPIVISAHDGWAPRFCIFKSAPPRSRPRSPRLTRLTISRTSIPQGRVVCPDAAAEFSRCAHLVINHTGKEADTPDCSKQLRKMRACLRRKRV